MDDRKDDRVTVRLPHDLYDALKDLARREERSLAQLLRRAARAYVDAREVRK
ncbi:MAG TPA: YlcI/YnfO family protein [Acidimicrobiales bacterium]